MNVALTRRRSVVVDVELGAFVALVVLGAVLRFVALGDKPLHHDESIHAWFSWRALHGNAYEYDPVYHGPLPLDLITFVFALVGAGDAAARVAPAVLGTMLVALPFFLRRQLGGVAALAAAGFFCLSPAYVYFSRFAREDIDVAFLTLALVATVFNFLDRPRRWHPALILGLLAASFATKESTFITVFLGGLFFIAAFAREYRQARALRSMPLVQRLTSVGGDAWLWGATTFAVVYTVLFTNFFFHPAGLVDGLTDGIRYWLTQQPVGRGSQPWFYYLVLFGGYEWPALLFGALGIWSAVRNPTLFRVFLVWMFLGSVVVYSWAGERMPWLFLHPLLPLLLLAGLGVQLVWGHRRPAVRVALVAAACVGAAYTVRSTTALAYANAANPKEILVFTQTSNDTKGALAQLRTLDRRVFAATRQHLTLDVDMWGGLTWPWAWYLRDLDTAGYVDMSSTSYAPAAQALLVADPDRAALAPRLSGYSGHRFKAREWWIPDYGHAGFHDAIRWLLWRTPWNPLGSLDEWLYVRNDVTKQFGA
jgi:uncharacterized protein (TIGR03663 family)